MTKQRKSKGVGDVTKKPTLLFCFFLFCLAKSTADAVSISRRNSETPKDAAETPAVSVPAVSALAVSAPAVAASRVAEPAVAEPTPSSELSSSMNKLRKLWSKEEELKIPSETRKKDLDKTKAKRRNKRFWHGFRFGGFPFGGWGGGAPYFNNYRGFGGYPYSSGGYNAPGYSGYSGFGGYGGYGYGKK